MSSRSVRIVAGHRCAALQREAPRRIKAGVRFAMDNAEGPLLMLWTAPTRRR